MNPRLTAALVLISALLAGAVFGLEKANVPAPQATPQATPAEFTVFSFEDRQVNAFTLTSADKSVRFEKRDDAWVIAETGAPANRISLTSLLIRLSQLKASNQFPDDSRDPTGYGVATPGAEAKADLTDGTSYSLLFGNKTPIGTNVYARKADGPEVYVLPGQLLTDLQKLVDQPQEPATPTPRPTATATADVPAGPVVTPTP